MIGARGRLAPDGKPRPDAPFGRGPLAARVLAVVIDLSARAGAVIPAPLAHALAYLGGHAEWALRPAKRRTLAVNLGHAVGRPPGARAVRRLVRAEIVNEARRSADLLWAIGRPGELLDTVEVVGREHAVAAAGRGRGVVLAGIHVGGWEVVAAVPAAILPVPTSVVVADNWLAWAMHHVRAGVGLRMVFRSDPALAAARVLRRGEALLVMGDDASGATPRLARVRFAHGAADLPAGIASLARLTGAAVVPFSVLPTGRRRWRVTVEPPIEPPGRSTGAAGEQAVLQQLADRWTALVTAHPEHWAAGFRIAWVESGQ